MQIASVLAVMIVSCPMNVTKPNVLPLNVIAISKKQSTDCFFHYLYYVQATVYDIIDAR